MTLEEFTRITLSVLSEGGIGQYAPTILSGEQVQVVQGIPEGLDHREALQEVLVRGGLAQAEYFFGVRSGPQEVTTGHHRDGATRFQRILGLSQGFTLVAADACPWWRMDDDGGPGH